MLLAIVGGAHPADSRSSWHTQLQNNPPPPEVSLRFIGLPEYQQDLIRARVFAEMRDLRRRGVL